MKYPVRCRIIDVTAQEMLPGIIRVTPEVSKPYIGQEGFAEEDGLTVKITLDSGVVLYGYECWWTPLSDKKGD